MATVNGEQHQVAPTHPSLPPTIPTPCDGTFEGTGGINSSNNSTTIDSNTSIAPAPTNTPAAETETDRVQIESPPLASSSNCDSSESFHTAASLNNTSNDSRSQLVRVLETNPEDQRVVAKETIEKYVHERKSVTIGNRHVQKTWTHVGSIEGDEPVNY